MEQQVLLWCVAVPAIAMVLAFGLAALGSRLLPLGSHAVTFQSACVVLGLVAGVAVSLVGRQSMTWWPEDFWQRSMWPVGLFGLALAMLVESQTCCDRWRALVLGISGAGVAYFALPTGEGWSDMYYLHRPWMLAVTVAVVVNLWSLDDLARAQGTRWVALVGMVGLGAACLLLAGAYASMAEWLLAGLVGLALAAVVGLVTERLQTWAAIYPTTMMAAVGTAAGRFYDYDPYPKWIYGVILFSPSAIALVDRLVRSRSAWVRVPVAFVVACILLGLIAWKTNESPGEEEW